MHSLTMIEVTPTYRKPFDFIAQFAQSKNAAPGLDRVENGAFDGWLALLYEIRAYLTTLPKFQIPGIVANTSNLRDF